MSGFIDNGAAFSSQRMDWETPQSLFDELDSEFHFTLDAAASDENAKCSTYFTAADDALSRDWGGADGVLQSSLWQGHQGVGAQMLSGGQQAGHHGCHAHPGSHGHEVVSGVDTAPRRGQVHTGPIAFRDERHGRGCCTVPEHGRGHADWTTMRKQVSDE